MGATSGGGGEATSGGLDLSPFLFAIDRAIETDDKVDDAEAYSHAQGIGEVQVVPDRATARFGVQMDAAELQELGQRLRARLALEAV